MNSCMAWSIASMHPSSWRVRFVPFIFCNPTMSAYVCWGTWVQQFLLHTHWNAVVFWMLFAGVYESLSSEWFQSFLPWSHPAIETILWAKGQFRACAGPPYNSSTSKGRSLESRWSQNWSTAGTCAAKVQCDSWFPSETPIQSAASYSFQFFPQTFLSPKCATQPTQTTHCLYSPLNWASFERTARTRWGWPGDTGVVDSISTQMTRCIDWSKTGRQPRIARSNVH